MVIARSHVHYVYIPPCSSPHYGVRSTCSAHRGYGVDLLSFDTAIKIKIFKFEYTTEHSDLPYFYSFHTSRFGSEVCEHFNNIWQHYVGEQIYSFVDKKFRDFNILHSLTLIIALINVSCIKHSRLWMNSASHKRQQLCFCECHAGVRIDIYTFDNFYLNPYIEVNQVNFCRFSRFKPTPLVLRTP